MGAKSSAQATELPKQQAGAPNALKFISEEEAASRKRFEEAQRVLAKALKEQRERAPEMDGKDFEQRVKEASFAVDIAIKDLEFWLKWLHKFDNSVEPERRDSSEKLSREVFEKMAQLLFITMRESVKKTSMRFCQEVLEKGAPENPQQVHKLMDGILCETMREGIRASVENQHLPEWCVQLAEGVI